ncbi:ATP-dependent sacrificial sulfur transferase LarE [Candidatus Acetothermia bacterium]|nr:ATP-dependent sacrificial sulfur transferase LarE [Candidatus Acetothermia bacterium]MBI3659414.1 ATP-dependent sacrificial sulfur transferase LarE [Candidatus Acetothermia bacterium]
MSELTTQEKFVTLQQILRPMEKVIVAFSGGVDSAFVLAVAKQILGDNVLAVTAHSEVYAASELEGAQALARTLGVEHKIIRTRELEDPRYVNNPPERCFHCKQELFGKLVPIAKELGFSFTVDGTNASDIKDFRPGMRAHKDFGVRSPLLEAGLIKEEIRLLSKQIGLPTWDKPAMACLASRMPYGSSITVEKLRQVEHAENLLYRFGFKQLRVRNYDGTARIEVLPEQMPILLANREEIVTHLKSLGFKYVTLDLQGFRSGSMNEILKKNSLTVR